MQNRRHSILKANAMLGAPRYATAFFWQRYNQRWRKPEQNLAELTDKLVEFGRGKDAGVVAKAWRESLPSSFPGHTCVEHLEHGRLSIIVDGKGSAYRLSRQYEAAILKSMNQKLGRGSVRSIVYRVRPAVFKHNDARSQ